MTYRLACRPCESDWIADSLPSPCLFCGKPGEVTDQSGGHGAVAAPTSP